MNHLPSLFGRRSEPSMKEIERVQRQMNSLFDRFWSGESLFDAAQDPELMGAFSPQADFEETEKEYLISVDVPGMKKEDLKIELHDNLLTISGERKEFAESGKKKGRNYRSERIYGSFLRSFHLPVPVHAEQAQAQCSDGVLKITIPKSETAKIQSIPIRENLSGKTDRTPEKPQTQEHTH